MQSRDLLRKAVIATFLSVPAISSIISTIHLIDLFNLGNPSWLSILLSVTFELGSIASFLALSVIERIKVGAVWFIFIVLAGLQIVGNVYYTYSFTSDSLLQDPAFLRNFTDLFSFIVGDDIRDTKIFLSCIIGIPIPLIALFFLKSNMDYLRPSTSIPIENDSIQENVSHSGEIIDEQPQLESYDSLEEMGKMEEEQLESTWESENPEEPRRRRTRVIGNTTIKY